MKYINEDLSKASRCEFDLLLRDDDDLTVSILRSEVASGQFTMLAHVFYAMWNKLSWDSVEHIELKQYYDFMIDTVRQRGFVISGSSKGTLFSFPLNYNYTIQEKYGLLKNKVREIHEVKKINFIYTEEGSYLEAFCGGGCLVLDRFFYKLEKGSKSHIINLQYDYGVHLEEEKTFSPHHRPITQASKLLKLLEIIEHRYDMSIILQINLIVTKWDLASSRYKDIEDFLLKDFNYELKQVIFKIKELEKKYFFNAGGVLPFSVGKIKQDGSYDLDQSYVEKIIKTMLAN